MQMASIYTALNVPTVTSYPSINCLQWSGDGQACFVTKSAVYILTPDPGINFDLASVVKAPVGKEKTNPLGWFRTMIEFNKDISKDAANEKPQSWPELSQEYAAISLGSLDVSVRAVACSPSNLTEKGRCVFAVLSSNMDLALWTSAKNHLKGEWIKIFNITPFLIELFSTAGDSKAAVTAHAQVVSIAWSQQPDFGIGPAPSVDGSLLVAGSRAGCLVFLRFEPSATADGGAHHIETLEVSDKWITTLAWTPWKATRSGLCEADIAYGTSDGGVGLIKVTQRLEPIHGVFSFVPQYSVVFTSEIMHIQPCVADKRTITALTWVRIADQRNILAFCKPGVIHLWAASEANLSWSGPQILRLQTQRLSVGSSALYPASGIIYVRSRDALIVSLLDGSFHVIHALSTAPSLDSGSSQDALTSHILSQTSRAVFSQTEPGGIHFTDVNRISGAMSYDRLSTIIWVHESSRPSDFSYKHDAKHNSMLIVTQLWDTDDECHLEGLAKTLCSANSASGETPIHALRTAFLYLRKAAKLPHIRTRVLDILRQPVDDDSVSISLSQWSGSPTPEIKRAFRRSLAQNLFGWDSLLYLRMGLGVADFCWKLSDSEEAQAECGQVAQHLLSSISHRVLRTIIRHLAAVVPALALDDVPFVSRMVIQSLLPGCPADLSINAQELQAAVNAAVPLDMQSSMTLHGLSELCPACNAEVALADLTSAMCPNGHAWSRCSITSFILATTMVRTCIGCSRKAFLPRSLAHQYPDVSNWLPTAARSWVVEELLESVNHCLFCGNHLVNIL